MHREDLKYYLALLDIPRLNNHTRFKLVKRYGINALFSLSETDLTALGLNAKQVQALLNPNWQNIANTINRIPSFCQVISIDCSVYPERLKHIHDPPIVLYCHGNLSLLSQPSVAVIGSRNASYQGRAITSRFSKELSQQGITIISGLALGVDGIAHQSALGERGNTIAVIATGIDKCYPARHKKLAASIIEQHGLIISEFRPGIAPKPGHFPRRNRIISGLSLATLVVEAALKSGSLVTARLAMEQNRDVFAVPGSIDNPLTKGCHKLIKEGAKLIDCVADIIEELKLDQDKTASFEQIRCNENNSTQDLFLDPLLASVDYEATPIDLVVSRSELPTNEVLTRLTMLELKGLVSAVPGGYLRLNRG